MSFSLLASSIYILNDIRDVAQDRLHPKKRKRPLAAGLISIPFASVMAGVFLVAALALAWVHIPETLPLLLAYALINGAYSFGLKEVAVVDILIVAGCYLLRILVGGTATGIPISAWLILTVFSWLFFWWSASAMPRPRVRRCVRY